MRPRVFPAEDVQAVGRPVVRVDHASMRPRVFPAEDRGVAEIGQRPHAASMRPRVFPAEDVRQLIEDLQRDKRFNEAAGIPRGRLDAGLGFGHLLGRLQ